MKTKHVFATLRRILVPVVYGSRGVEALRAALALGAESVVAGFVRVSRGEALSAGAASAAEVRRALRAMAAEGARARARVRVSYDPWPEIVDVAGATGPDLLILEWPSQLEAIGVQASEVLARPPCDMALVRGPFVDRPGKVLVPVRGGPHAELALRLALSLRPYQLVALHLTRPGEQPSEAPFRGIEQVLRRMPEVEIEYTEGDDPAQAILDRSAAFDLVLMGSTTQLTRGRASFGAIADRVLREAPVGVVVVKTRRRMEAPHTEEGTITGAISILVDKWFAENTYAADEFADLEDLVRRKQEQGLSISLALPSLNEEETVGNVIRAMQGALMEDVPLLDEIVLIDSSSTDRTREIALGLGVPVYIHQDLLPELGARKGKGEALWKSLLVTRGDIVAWIDTDIRNIHPRFVYGILGPLLIRPRIQLVKGFYRRPLRVSGRLQAGGGGRATELTARPLFNLFYPELSGIIQPLSGEYAGRRRMLENLPFASGYGVETGLLIDIVERHGLAAIAQVDLLERVHHNQSLEALSKMSFAIIQTVVRRLERRLGASLLDEVNRSMKLIRYESGGYFLDVEEIIERERPPMISLDAYRQARAAWGDAFGRGAAAPGVGE